jgi:acetylglutamate kinase
MLDAIASDICELLSTGRTVVVVDSGGQLRTEMVCKHMRAVEDTTEIGRK